MPRFTTIREVVYSIRHHGCPVSDASASVPEVRISTVSKLEKEDNLLRSLLHIKGDDDDVAAYIDRLEAHEVPTTVEPADSVSDKEGTYIVLSVAYDESIPSIAGILSDFNCFQPTAITVSRGYENWPIYHDESVDTSAIAEKFRDIGLPFDIQRDVNATKLPEDSVVTGNETQGLTNRQYEVIEIAKRMGYYENNNSVTMSDIAAELNLTSATVCEHLNRAENHIISNAVDTESQEATAQSHRKVQDGNL